MSRVVIAQYRHLLRAVRVLRISEQDCYVNIPPTMEDFKSPFKFLSVNHNNDTLLASFPPSLHHLVGELQSRSINGTTFERLIKSEFRATRSRTDIERAIDSGFEAIRSLSLQLKIREVTSTAVTQDVRVVVTTIYNPQKESDDGYHVYCYRIVIENIGSENIQVLGRHWLFKAGEDFQVEVPKFAPGIVGEMPVIKPGNAFQYISSTKIKYVVGSMEGVYLAVNMKTGKNFELVVPKCNLLPITFH